MAPLPINNLSNIKFICGIGSTSLANPSYEQKIGPVFNVMVASLCNSVNAKKRRSIQRSTKSFSPDLVVKSGIPNR